MQGGSRVVMDAGLGALMAVDFGGPINKAAYLFGTVALAGGQEEFMITCFCKCLTMEGLQILRAVPLISKIRF